MRKRKKLKKIDINDIYEEEKVRKFYYYYELNEIQFVYEEREDKDVDIYNYAYFEEICKEVEELYFKEYKKRTEENSLISEKYILAYKKKYFK